MSAHSSRSLLFVFLLLAVFAAATGPASTTTVTVTKTATSTAIPANQCSTGNIQCCNNVEISTNKDVGILLGLLGIIIQGVEALVGLNCSPISVIGLPGNSCSAQVVCCENNHFNGLIAIGCTPININL